MLEYYAIVVSFIENFEVGYKFTHWPNHITIVPYFKTSNINALVADINKITTSFVPVNYEVGSIDYFGQQQNTKVSLINTNPLLTDLHAKMLAIATAHDLEYFNKYSSRTFRPHITHNQLPYPEQGDKHLLDKIYLIYKPTRNTKDKVINNVFVFNQS